ncbi:MAG TPA: UDP-N-acetylmuramoyl-L-alanine--D-glutamate ligase [Streptosporangiaceae bacterium]|nr:UDP-N-acetylmuramoyl-L-alanine--D-glutamate ligase [Streptosporangiaceae bacterium]
MTGSSSVTGLADLAGRSVVVAGVGITGQSVSSLLTSQGARVTALDSRDDAERRDIADRLAKEGVAVRLGPQQLGPDATVPPGTALVVTSPGLRPDTPLLASAVAAGIEVIGDVELAWRLRPGLPGGGRQQWLAITGTNGKTTTVRMLAAMLAAAGHRSIAAGNVGTPILDVVTDPEPYPVVAVELSSFQLYWSATIRPLAAAVLNLAAHHLDWHDDIESYAAAKARIFAPGTIAIYNAEDPATVSMAAAAARREPAADPNDETGARAGAARLVGFRLGQPGPGELGVADGWLVDGAFIGGAIGERTEPVRLAPVSAVQPAAPHNVADALAAAALARAYGDQPASITAGLAAFVPEPHRITLVTEIDGVAFVDDSKASNPAAAAASLASFPSVVWVAGGLFRGSDDDLEGIVATAAPRLRAAFLIGTDRARFAKALARHAPNVPVTELSATDTGVMDQVVAQAAAAARRGDTVLLAPAAQSWDMFRDYPARGNAFAAAVRRLADSR